MSAARLAATPAATAPAAPSPLPYTPPLRRDLLPAPRVLVLPTGGHALLLGYITDRQGRRLWAEVCVRSQFIDPAALCGTTPLETAHG